MKSEICSLLLIFCCLQRSIAVETGINGHPLIQEGYRSIPLSTQLELVRKLGVGWYRCDWGSDVAGAGGDRAAQLLREAAARGICVLPALFPPVDLDKDSEDTIRTKAREYARTVVTRFSGQVHVWELHNELDNFAMIRKGDKNSRGEVWNYGPPNGAQAEDYEEGRYRRARAVLRGLAEGVREADPSARRIINSAGWLHFGFIQRLVSDAVPFEILGWHWYSEMGDMTSAGGTNVIEKISAFGKPIWLNEFNRRGGNSGPKGQAEQATSIADMARSFRSLSASYPIACVMAYELFDEPYFGADNPESHYGLVKLAKGKDGTWTPGERHPAFDTLRREFAAYPKNSGPPTLAELPAKTRAQIDLRLRRKSTEISASPFATLDSIEVHGESEDAAVIRTMGELGVKWVVMHNIHDCLIDPANHRLNEWLRLCREAGIGVQCILASRDPEVWRKGVQYYGDRIRTFYYLNEPNAPKANNHADPVVAAKEYAKEAAEIGKLVHATRPGVRVFGPELAMMQSMEEWPHPWLRLAQEEGLAAAVDGVSVHPYRQSYSTTNIPENPSTFEGRPGTGYSTYEGQIAVLRRMFPGKPFAVTEVGWSTAPQGPLNGSTSERISELTQAKFALRQQIMDFALGADIATYFLLRERYENQPCAPGHIENHFGIVHTDNSPKPAFTALQTLYSQLDSRSHLSLKTPVSFGRSGVKWFLFEDSNSKVPVRRLVYWLPVPARDDCPVERTDVIVDGVKISGVNVSDAPRILRLHQIKKKWGWPAVIDLVGQSVEEKVVWSQPH